MSRSRLVAASAALTFALAACASDGDDTGTEATSEQDGAAGTDAAAGDVTGTVTDAQVADDGSATLTVDTGDGEQELTASSAAYITTSSDGGGQRRARLSTWLESNTFDEGTEYAFTQRDGVVTDIRG